MLGLIEIHTGFTTIGNIYNFRKFPPRTKLPENLQPYYSPH